MKSQNSQTFSLSRETIDEISELLDTELSAGKTNHKDILRLRLATESVLEVWLNTLGEGCTCRYQSRRIMMSTHVTLQVQGDEVNPTDFQDMVGSSISNHSDILSALGLTLEYQYENGYNTLRIAQPKSVGSNLLSLVFAVVTGLGLGFALKYLTPEFGKTFYEGFASPVFNTMMRLISCIAVPMVGLSVISGIVGMGDVSSFSKIGKSLTSRFVRDSVIFMILIMVPVLPFCNLALNGPGESGGILSKILELLLGIVPTSIVNPLAQGNLLQLIFLSVLIGIALLIMGDSADVISRGIQQLSTVISMIMSWIGKLMPGFIFLCFLSMVFSSGSDTVSALLIPIAYFYASFIILTLAIILVSSIQYRIPFGQLIKKILPPFLLALSANSSVAALDLNMKSCREELKIDPQFVNFGIPFGQVVYPTGNTLGYCLYALFAAKACNLPITPSWLIMCLLVSYVLSVATPPVAGGSIGCLSILFAQLGIPAEQVVFSISLYMVCGYIQSSCKVTILQMTLFRAAHKLDMIQK